jgi:predicted flavoprotein YhiN
MPEAVWNLVIVGGGAAGLAAGLTAARRGRRVVILERTNECGKKLAITGGKKGNFTHADEPEIMARQFNTEPRTLLPLMRRFPFTRIVAFFEELGIHHLVDDDGCIWPNPKSAPRLRDELVRAFLAAGGRIETGTHAANVQVWGHDSASCPQTAESCPPKARWLVRTDTGSCSADSVLIATGGKSYPATGSSGDGYQLAARLGIRVEPVYSALASLVTRGEFAELSGITVGKTTVRLRIEDAEGTQKGRRRDAADSGERSDTANAAVLRVKRSCEHSDSALAETAPFLFAGPSITGRAVINLCGFAGKALLEGRKVTAVVDWLPDQSDEELFAELADQRMRHGAMHVSNFIAAKSAKRLALLLCVKAQVPEERKLAELSRDETRRLLDALKRTEIEVVDTEPLARATVTGGGVALGEVDMNTFESRRHRGLYFAGELLDVWGRSGGYNLHFAWASGIAVGEAV